MSQDTQNPANPIAQTLNDTLGVQKRAFAQTPAPTVQQRIDRLNRLHNAVVDYKDRLIAAVDADFSGRASAETEILEILPVLEGIAYNKKRVKGWMQQSRRHTPLMLFGSTTKVHYQPLGVIGIVVPWNFPIFLGLSPLVGALTAGNRAMIKTSEFAPRTGELVKEMIEATFSPDEVTVHTGGVEVASEFTKLPFDHLVFTGSTQVGKIVMRAAAENLTPVTLELGGKSPAIIHESFPIEEAAKRIAFGKGLNAGQVCVSPDYILVHRSKLPAFTAAFEKAMTGQYPSLRDNADYTAIITERQQERLEANLQDAREKGATIREINPKGETFDGTRKMSMHVVTDVTDDMRIMQEEIFGPILPVVPYDTLDEAIAYVNARPRPLALYYFDWDKARGDHMLNATHSGGVCLNDVMTHVAVDDMPFGGVGPSGMGHYHGKEGFLNFSKAKGVVRKGRFNPTSYIQQPWGNSMYNFYMRFQYRRYRKIG
ncbi:MAG: coniferyl aldehyde dehydrogenase [Pelagimonas sp.]|jgi:coniferyl-aldehyde dehydrogenase|nr:coniferyl aldehyde dehydrogenase [Pelagimonas sp.]